MPVNAEAVFEELRAPALLVDERGVIEAVNGALRRELGYSAQDAVGRPLAWIVDASGPDVASLFGATTPVDRLRSVPLRTTSGAVLRMDVAFVPRAAGYLVYLREPAVKPSENRKTQERLKLHAEIFERTSEGIAVIDLQGRYTEQNAAHRAMLGYPDGELLGNTPDLHLIRPRFEEVVAQVREKGCFNGEILSRARDGRALLLELSAFSLRGEHGEVLYHVGIKRDITQQRTDEQRLREAEARYRRLVEQMPAVTYVATLEGVHTYISPQIERMLGYPPSEWLTSVDRWVQSVHPEDRARVAGEIARFLRRFDSFREEYRMIARDGRVVWCHDEAVAVKGPEGKPLFIQGVVSDVTDFKKVEERLRFRESLLDCQSEASPEGILVVSTEGKMLSFNRRFVQMWNLPESIVQSGSDDAAIQSVLHKLVNPHEFLARIRYLYEHRDEESRDEILLKDGRIFERYSAPIRTREGVHYGRIWFFSDVTEAKRSERRLVAQHVVTRILAESATMREATPRIIEAVCLCLGWDVGAIWQFDAASGELRCIDLWHAPGAPHAEFERITRTSVFSRGVGLPGRVLETRKPAWIADVLRDENFPRAPVARREGLHSAFGFPILLGEQILGVIEFFSREIRQPDPELLEMLESLGAQIGQFLERVRAEERVRDSEQKYRAVVETARDAIVSADADGSIIFFNSAAERIFGYSSAEAVGRPLTFLMPERYRQRHLAAMDAFLRTGRMATHGRALEVSGLRKDGSEFPLEISLADWTAHRKVFFTGILRDITERHRAQEETRAAYENLKKAQKELIRAEKLASVGMVMAGVAHEINNPLNVMYGNLRLLKDRCAAMKESERPAKVEQMVRDALVAAENARRIIEEFRHFARDSSEAEPVDLALCLREAIEIARAKGRRIRVVQRIGRLPKVKGFSAQLRRAFANLIKNAFEAIDGAGTVTLSAARRRRSVVIEVRDTGRGIPKEHLERIFEPFFTTKERGRGFGLGLALAEALLENHGGTLSVRSRLGRGTCFTVRLPIG